MKKSFLRKAVAALTLAVAFAWTATLAQAAPFVYVTNVDSGNLSQYDAAGGTLAPLSPATVSAGLVPWDVAVSPEGRDAYVGMEAATVSDSAILHYKIGATGTLTLFGSSGAFPRPTIPGALVLSPDGRSLYAINIGGSSVIQYTVETDGDLTLKSPPTVATAPAAGDLAISPDGRNLYVMGGSAVSQYTVGADGTLSPKSPPTVAVDGDPYIELSSVAVSPDGQNVYVVDADAGSGLPGAVLQYTVAADGTLSPKSPPTVPAGTDPFRLVVSPDGRSVYVTHSQFSETTGVSIGTVLQYTVGTNGTLSPKSPASVAAGPFPAGIAISGNGKNVYAVNEGDAISQLSNTVSQYSVGAGGALSPKSPAAVAAGTSPYAIAITPLPRLPTTTAQCMNGGWKQFGFQSQGRCVAFVVLTRICDALERHGIHLKFCPPTPPNPFRPN